MSNWPTFDGQLSNIAISPNVLAMIPKEIMEKRLIMPIDFNELTGQIKIVTSNYESAFGDIAIISQILRSSYSEVRDIELLAVTYENFTAGFTTHYREQFTPAMDAFAKPSVFNKEDDSAIDTTKITSEQTKLADEILTYGINVGASDIHITPQKEGAVVEFRIDGKIRPSNIVLNDTDEVMITNIYKRNAKLEVNNLVGQDGRFTFLGRDFRLSTQPYGNSGRRNKVVLRVIGSSDTVQPFEKLSFSEEEIKQLRRLISKPSGIILVCGPTGEGKSTTLYSCINELADTTNSVIVTVEDPIEKYIDGVAQTQVRLATSEHNSLTFEKALRSMLRQDPDIIMVGEIRDKETAVVAVQASQTGHLILSTLHVRNSISVFRRLEDMGANVSGFAEQIVGVSSQRLLSVNCPHCRKAVVSKLNERLREQDLTILKDGIDEVTGIIGKVTYESVGCDKCNHTGIEGRIPIIEIIEFNNYLRDYFSVRRGLIEIEKYLRKNLQFKSLWDKGMAYVADGKVSLKELLSCIDPDEDLREELDR